jgi:fermentation-respiration switch protein FrsA (DUF1100 family)
LTTKLMMTTALWLGGALVLIAVLAWLFQRRLIYFPLVQEVPAAASVLPGTQEVQFETADGLTLAGWLVPAAATKPLATVLFLPGNAGNRSFRAPLAAALAGRGLQTLLIDYRGYGGNPGSPSQDGLLTDARAAYRYLAGREDVDADRLIYLGESLGAAVAVALAREHPPAALILRSPFASLAEVGRRHFPFLPVGLLLTDHYPSKEWIGQVSCPVLVLAGEADSIVPLEHSRRLYEAAPSPKRLVTFPGADHNDLEFLVGERFLNEITAFVRARLEEPG